MGREEEKLIRREGIKVEMGNRKIYLIVLCQLLAGPELS